MANRAVRALFLIHSDCSGQINIWQYALSGTRNSDGFPPDLGTRGLCLCVDTRVGSSLLPQQLLLSPGTAQGIARLSPRSGLTHTGISARVPCQVGSRRTIRFLSPNVGFLREICQDQTGSRADHLPCMSMPLMCALRGKGAPVPHLGMCLCALEKLSGELWSGMFPVLSGSRHRVCVSAS